MHIENGDIFVSTVSPVVLLPAGYLSSTAHMEDSSTLGNLIVLIERVTACEGQS